MKKQLRVSLLSALCATGVLMASPTPSVAQPAKEADEHNTAGKELFKERRYLEAYRRFKQAAALSPEGRFYFNICFSLNYLERFQEAIDACEAVEPNGADAALLEKTAAVLEALRAKVPATPPPNTGTPVDPNTGTPVDPNTGTAIDPNTGTPTDPNTGTPVDPNTGQPIDPNAGTPTGPNAGQPSTGPATVPGLDPFAQKKATGEYAWALGVTASPLANLGLGDTEDFSVYAGGGFGLNIFANFMYKAEQQIGLQAYLGFANLPPEDDVFTDPLNIIDIGGAVYKHIPINDKFDITPLVGIHVSLMQPEANLDEALLALGVRLQSSIDYHLGANKEHVISFAPALNLYSGASSTSSIAAEAFGLDTGGATFEFGIGYEYRFTNPFGSGPLFTLE
tara:strand:+ start:17416 stop:18600 length:1185 start_codon:yes stop_codon:yes gene_type:complete